MARDALCFPREDRAVPEYGRTNMARLAQAGAHDLRAQPDHGIPELVQGSPKIYRAGVSLAGEAKNLPEGLRFEKFWGGKYSQFVLTGPYSDLPAASGRVFEIVAERKIQMHDDYCIENYVTDPQTTPQDQCITKILIPTI